jgi:hypothetical protein
MGNFNTYFNIFFGAKQEDEWVIYLKVSIIITLRLLPALTSWIDYN